jgi:protein-disulfide isomerase
MKRSVSTGVLTLFAGSILLGVVSMASAQDQAKIIEYYRRKANVPPAAPVTVEGMKDSPIAGAKQGTLSDRGRKVGFLVSNDGKYAVFGELEDLTVDPFKAVMAKIDTKGRPMKGPADAKVTIVEYSDFQCPFCTRGYDTIEKQVLPEYKDKVRFVYKHFPLGFHPWATPAAVAVECVNSQKQDEAYWKLYSYYFEHQKEVNPQNVKDKAKEALAGTKVDMAKFEQCFDKQETLARVQADMAEGQAVGVSGTPGFIINGRLISGAQPFQNFKSVIDDELARGN